MRITYVGHSTVLVESKDTAIITDPFLTTWVAGLPRRLEARPSVDELPPITALTVSHAHTDHLHAPSVKLLARRFRGIAGLVPHGVGSYLKSWGIDDVTEMEPYASVTVGDITVASVPLPHVKGRWAKWQDTATAGYVFMTQQASVLVAGDIDFTGSMEIFREIGSRYRVDVACLPVSGMMPVSYYEKRRGRPGVHIDPLAALDIAEALGARRMIPIHWGAVSLRLGPVDEAPRRLLEHARQRGREQDVIILWPGDAWDVES